MESGKPENKGERASARQTERQVNHGAEKSEKRSADPGSGDSLPPYVQETVKQSGVEITSREQLQQCANHLLKK